MLASQNNKTAAMSWGNSLIFPFKSLPKAFVRFLIHISVLTKQSFNLKLLMEINRADRERNEEHLYTSNKTYLSLSGDSSSSSSSSSSHYYHHLPVFKLFFTIFPFYCFVCLFVFTYHFLSFFLLFCFLDEGVRLKISTSRLTWFTFFLVIPNSQTILPV